MLVNSRVLDPALDERCSQAYHDLAGFVHWLANNYKVHGSWVMNFDDLVAEGYLTIVRLAQMYLTKPYNEFLTIVRVAITNWYRTLRGKSFLTFRKFDHYLIDLDGLDGRRRDWPGNGLVIGMTDDANRLGSNPAELFEMAEQVDAALSELSEFDRQVVDCITGGNERVALYIDLVRQRKHWVFDDPTITVTPHIVAMALCVDDQEILASYKRIKHIFQIV